MEHKKHSFNQDSPIYNIRLLRIYIDYIERNYPIVNIDKILNYTGISRLQLNDFGYWYNQKQANRFHEIIARKTGNKNIAKDAARELMKSQNLFAQYLMGFKNPEAVALGIGKIYSKGSIGAKASAKKRSKNIYEVIIKTEPGVKEQHFQCQNRIGALEGIFHFFTHEYPEIIHKECIHQGGKACRYIVKIKNTSKLFKWLRIRIHLSIISLISTLLIYKFVPFQYFLLISLLLYFALFLVFHYADLLEKSKLKYRIKNLSEIAEEHWYELNISYRATKLMQEVGSVTSVVQNKNEIASAVLKVMVERMDYWRCVILLDDIYDKTFLCANSYGFTEEDISIIKNCWLSSDADNESILQKVFKNQEPVLIEDMRRSNDILNSNDLEIAKKLKIQSMICVPIVHEGESLGIIVVDSLKFQREFREGDINLLMAVASQTALSIANARSFQKLQESEKKHRTLVETIRDIVYTIDLEGRFTYVSPMVAAITGHADKELLGREFTEIVNPPYKDKVMQRFSDGLKSGDIATYEIEILTKEKEVVPIELNVAPLTDNKGQMIGRIGVARDITRRQQEETKRQEMEMRALTQDKLASLGEIATGVAHEINQPLSYIKIILESTLNDIADEKLDRAELSGDCNESLRQVAKITNIISHLRTFGRSDVTSFNPVKLSRVLDDTLILMNERLRIKNITIDIQLAEHLPLLHGNHVKLEQIFVNLIQNSMDAIEEQGKGGILLSAQVDNNEVLITYSDTGKGIDPRMQEKIFEPFFTTKEPGKGTGIGLSIVYGIIQEHKGTITCESEKGKGATFKIRLPIYLESSDPLSAPLNA
jgi:PAS domain S-box-containing protein